MFKKLYYFVFVFLFSINDYIFASNATDDTIKTGLISGLPGGGTDVITDIEGKSGVESIFTYVKDSIFGVLALIVIGTFLYIGYKIVTSMGKPEEFKKAFMMLIYAVLGMLFIALSWVMVVFITGLKI